MIAPTTQLHASCASFEVAGTQHGVLLLGPSGCGKSDVTLRLVETGAHLVADDRVDVVRLGESLHAGAPVALRGLLEARGVGLLTLPHMQDIRLSLAVQLSERHEIERLPPEYFWDCLGARLPLLLLHAFDASICAKIRHALAVHKV